MNYSQNFRLGVVLILIGIMGCQSPPVQLPAVLVKAATVSFDYVDQDTIYSLSTDTTRYHPEPNPDAWYWFWHQQQLQTRMGDYTGQLLHGSYVKQLRDGTLLQKGEFAWGLPDGTWRPWAPAGALVAMEGWKRGLRDGEARYYNEQGQLIAEGEYAEGLQHGEWTERAPNGTWITTTYDKGMVVVPEVKKEEDDTTETPEG